MDGDAQERQLSGIDLRKVFLPNKRKEAGGERDHDADDRERRDPVPDYNVQQPKVSGVKPGEPAFEAGMKPGKEPGFTLGRRVVLAAVLTETSVVFLFDQHIDEDRNDGSRQQVGNQHGKHHRERPRREQELWRICQEQD